MRITSSMLSRNSLMALSNTMDKLYESSNRLSSGKKIRSPQDAPSVVKTLADSRQTLFSNNQYVKNIKFALSRLSLSDQAVETVYSEVSLIKEKTSRVAAEFSGEIKQNLIEEIEISLKNIASALNKKDKSVYVFSGTNGFSKTYEAVYGQDPDGVSRIQSFVYQGNDEKINVKVSDNETAQSNMNGREVIETSDDNIFSLLIELRKAIINSNSPNDFQDRLNSVLDHLNSITVGIGSKTQNLERMLQRIDEDNLSTSSNVSSIADTDYSKELVDYENIRNRYEAVLKVLNSSAKLNLMDYL